MSFYRSFGGIGTDMRKLLFSLLLASALSACSTTESVGSSDTKLAGTSWQWSTEHSSDPYISFLENGHLRGSTGCNSISGVYEVTGDMKYGKHYFRLGEIISTEMACPDTMKTEATFLKVLRFSDSYSLSSDQLLLHDEDGTVIATLDRKTG